MPFSASARKIVLNDFVEVVEDEIEEDEYPQASTVLACPKSGDATVRVDADVSVLGHRLMIAPWPRCGRRSTQRQERVESTTKLAGPTTALDSVATPAPPGSMAMTGHDLPGDAWIDECGEFIYTSHLGPALNQ